MKSAENLQASTSGNYELKWRKGKATGNDELIKYMNNLPSYLEKGENIHDKVLSVGVLDWDRLEKWQCNRKQIPIKNGMASPPSSNASPLFTTDRSSANSSEEQSCSPPRHSRHRPKLQTHLSACPKEIYSEGAQIFNGNSENNQELKSARSASSKGKKNLLSTDHSSYETHSGIRLEHCKSKAAPETVPKGAEYSEVKSRTRKTKLQDGGSSKSRENLHMLNSNFSHKDYLKGPEEVVLILPRVSPQVSNSRASPLPGLTITTLQRSTKASQGSFSGSSNSQGRGSFSDSSCTEGQESFSESPYHQDTLQAKLYSEISHTHSYATPSLPDRTNKVTSHRDRKTEEKPVLVAVNSAANKPFEDPGLPKMPVVAPKERNLSPIRGFSVGMGKTSRRNSCTDDDVATPQLNPNRVTSKFVSGKGVVSPSLDKISNLRQNAPSRSWSSPLRRLLDPLVKPKAVNCRSIAEPLLEDLTSSETTSKSSYGRLNSATTQPVKVKLSFTGCRTVKVVSSCQNESRKSSAVHALLKVALKNGLPVFTLAVDNESEVLAATGRRPSTARKDEHWWTYTFLTIQEVKKKNAGWMNQGGKDKRHGYITNVVARMKVSDALSTPDPNKVPEFSMKEFVLCSADEGQADLQSLTVKPNDELAAIVIKIPRAAAGSLINGMRNSDIYGNLPAESGLDGTFAGSKNPSSMTVILPSGVHSAPSKGEPSSLIERWKSGGSCDCGGWDLGCKLRVLANENQLLNASSSWSNEFDLFDQDEVLGNHPVFTLVPFRNGIYSVEFCASLSHLQAFSICIAVLDSGAFGALPHRNGLFDDEDEVREDIAAKYVSCPPLSPAERA